MEMHYDEKELKKVQDRDFTYSWISSSAFLFCLTLGCFIAFMVGCSYSLYSKRFHKPKVHIQESSRYVPQYR